jgi:thiol-disulfide isomerase/thioredoxin
MRESGTMRTRLGTAVLIAAIGLLAACEQGPATSGSSAPASKIEPIDAPGLRSLLESDRGQVILVNLWASWCAPCLKEIPELVRLQHTLADKGFRLVGVSLDAEEDLETAKKLRDSRFPDFPTYHSTEGDWYALAHVVGPDWNGLLPTSFVVDRKGRLAATFTGGQSYDEFAAAVEPLL